MLIPRLLSALCLVALAAACGADETTVGSVIAVPGDRPTIQAAVDAARPGDLVLVSEGTYHESVQVDIKGITIRGEDRNQVLLDGQDQLINGFMITADGVAIENLTVHHFRQNGVMFNGTGQGSQLPAGEVYGAGEHVLTGYRASYVTAYDNGLYGIYAFASRDGLIEHVMVSGHPDSGIYIGQCKPCNAVVTDSIAANNAIGYYGTNASGGVYVVDNTFRLNRLGVAPNSQKMELLTPQAETVVAGNLVEDNDNPAAPAIQRGFFAGGIAVGGGTANVIVRNRVTGHDGYGIGLVDLNEFDPIANRVEGNVLAGNRLDLYFQLRPGAVSALGNCFAGNEFATSAPAGIESLFPCDAPAQPFEIELVDAPVAPDDADYRQIPAPGPQPTMPGDIRSVPTAPASAPPPPALDTITVPAP